MELAWPGTLHHEHDYASLWSSTKVVGTENVDFNLMFVKDTYSVIEVLSRYHATLLKLNRIQTDWM